MRDERQIPHRPWRQGAVCARVGILMLETRFPRIPGATPARVVFDKAAGLLPAFLDAAGELVRLGADGITTTCGFLSLYQREIAAYVGVPVATSSLMQIPLIERVLPADKRVGVLTISAASLTREHLIAAGADPDTPVVGTEGGGEFTRAILGDAARLDIAAAERDILDAGKELVARHPDTGAVLLECTNMVPYARVLSEHLRLPVFSIYSFVSWFQAGLVPRDFGPSGSPRQGSFSGEW